MDSQDKAAKSTWMKECQNLRIKFRMLNRTKYQPLLSLRPEGKNMVEQLEKLEKRHQMDQDEESAKLFHAINSLRKATKELKSLLGTVTGIAGEQKLATLQHKTGEIESGLKQFKLQSRNRYEELATEETELMKDMEMYHEKFEAWSKEKAERIPKKEIKSKVKAELAARSPHGQEDDYGEDEYGQGSVSGSMALKKRLEKIDQEIIGLGGVYLGWSRSDHDDYLKLRTKHKGKVKTVTFVNELQKLIPDISAEDVMAHNNNYDTYLKLCNEKKELLSKYKELKKIEAKRENEENEIDKENTEKSEKKPVKQIKEEIKKQKAKVNEWKKQKEQIVKEKEEKEKQEKQAKEKERLAKIEMEKQKKKQLVQEYKQKKAVEEMQKKEQELAKAISKKKLSPEELVKLQEREQATFQKRVEKVQSKKLEQIDKLERVEKMRQTMQSNFKHVPSKLTSETAAQLSKKREKFDGKGEKKDALTFGGNLVYTQMRAVPSWRAGLQQQLIISIQSLLLFVLCIGCYES
eukprot:TRINITY_DN87_c0_g1_i1.p1 TRINITY_DN87_c0_g1~~TRINITY_DN87_c0_g1_i1.p1  ORF type:complete len:520 (+),score=108.43 TRINITY_DN87_c0_g1_i1:458-2017(+)